MFVKFYGASDRGRARQMNQDSLLYNEEISFGVVADGIGGRPGGDKASEIVTKTISRLMLEPHEIRFGQIASFMVAIVDEVNKEIQAFGQANPEWRGMGSTADFLFFSAGELHLAHVGDSRTYLITKNSMFLLTIDHNVETFIERGLMKQRPSNYSTGAALTRALGLHDYVDVDVYRKKIVAGEIYLTASDGLFDMVSDRRILEIINAGTGDLKAVVERLVNEANKNGGRDNITVLLSLVTDS